MCIDGLRADAENFGDFSRSSDGHNSRCNPADLAGGGPALVENSLCRRQEKRSIKYPTQTFKSEIPVNLAIPKIFQQLTAALLIALMTSPAWSQSQVTGTVITSKSAVVQDIPLLPGSTIFNGDSISVNETGSAQIALPGGGRIELLEGVWFS